LDPLARETLTMLQDRKQTLKDFQAKVNYDVMHAKTEDREGKMGTVDYLSDPKAGSTFSARFDIDTSDGTPIKKHRQDLVFDGTNVYVIDYAGKSYIRRGVLAPDAKPGDATSLNGGMPLPIGLDADEVARNFAVTILPSSGADQVVLRLVPREESRGKFEFKKLVLTVDKKLQLPVKVLRTERNSDETTVQFSDIAINTGKSKMVDTTLPTGGDWTLDLK
jgi:outer membrane lipoprotein-sorting protein